MSEQLFTGEITLIKIQDGTDGASVEGFQEFYLLKSDAGVPMRPDAYYNDGGVLRPCPIDDIIKLGWSTEYPQDKFGPDYPYIWNFTRTTYGNNKISHSEAVIASYWAASPGVKAQYAINPSATWEEVYDESKHNYIRFSYDGGETWTPEEGIRIKAKVEIDENAVTFQPTATYDEIVLYMDSETNNIIASPQTITFQMQKQYLGLVELVDLDSEGDKEKGTYKPTITCELNNYSDLSQPIVLTDIIKEISAKGEPVIVYDYNNDLIDFNFGVFYEGIKAVVLEAESKGEYRPTEREQLYLRVKNIIEGIESFLVFTIGLSTSDGIQSNYQKKCPIRYATNYDLANFSVHAHGITQAIRNTKLFFDVEGLTLTNGGIRINATEYKRADPQPTAENFSQKNYYIEVEGGYREFAEYSPDITYWIKGESGDVFSVGQDGTLFLKGSGTFSGSIYATDGVFSGKIQATSGSLENLTVNGEISIATKETDTVGIKIRGQYVPLVGSPVSGKTYYYFDEKKQEFISHVPGPGTENAIRLYDLAERPGIESTNFNLNNETKEFDQGFYLDPIEGKIWAGSIALGKGAFIHDKMIFGVDEESTRGVISNPEKYKGVFIEAFDKVILPDNNYEVLSVLRVTTGGQIRLGPKLNSDSNEEEDDNLSNAIILDGPDASIRTKDYSEGLRGWRIGADNAEFNSVTVRGTFRTSVFEYDKVSAVGGAILVRPSALIARAEFANEERTRIKLYLDSKLIDFVVPTEAARQEALAKGYYFRIGTNDVSNIGESGASGSAVHLRGKEAYVWVDETPSSFATDAEKIVEIRKFNGSLEFTQEDLNSFGDAVLISYGQVGEIGIGLNSQCAATALPPEAISVFETGLITTSNGSADLQEKPRIILGKISKAMEQECGLTGYGLYADNVNVKGELTSRTEYLYSGINSNSQVYAEDIEGLEGLGFTEYELDMSEKQKPGSKKQRLDQLTDKQRRKREERKIILWGGADISGSTDKYESYQAIRQAPFRVDLKGRVFASEGEFSGKISGSDIYASNLYATTIYGYDREDKKDAALTIRDAERGIVFQGAVQRTADGAEYETFMSLSTSEMLLNVFLKANKGLETPTLSITKHLAIGNSRIRLGADKDNKKDLSILYKRDWDLEGSPLYELIRFKGETADELKGTPSDNWSVGTYVYEAIHLQGEIYFGEDQAMEYKKVVQENTQKIIGYDLYIKS